MRRRVVPALQTQPGETDAEKPDPRNRPPLPDYRKKNVMKVNTVLEMKRTQILTHESRVLESLVSFVSSLVSCDLLLFNSEQWRFDPHSQLSPVSCQKQGRPNLKRDSMIHLRFELSGYKESELFSYQQKVFCVKGNQVLYRVPPRMCLKIKKGNFGSFFA